MEKPKTVQDLQNFSYSEVITSVFTIGLFYLQLLFLQHTFNLISSYPPFSRIFQLHFKLLDAFMVI